MKENNQGQRKMEERKKEISPYQESLVLQIIFETKRNH